MPDVDVISPRIFQSVPGIQCAISTRRGGAADSPFGLNLSYNVGDTPERVEANRKRFFRTVGVEGERLAIPKQCHSAHVAVVAAPGVYEHVDGLVTDRTNVWLAVSVADCVPMFLVDRNTGAVAGIHAGWRGSAEGIVERGIELLRREFGSNPTDMLVFIGPSAGRCCYRVGPEVARLFSDGAVRRTDDGMFLDLQFETRRQLEHQGVGLENIETNASCTICTPGIFHSFRRDGKRSGRMMGVIGRKE